MKRALTERDCDRIAAATSVGLHLLLFLLFFLFSFSLLEDADPPIYRVPVEMTIVETAPPPPPKPKPVAKSKELVSTQALPNTPKTEAKPTRLPGDRDFPIVAKYVAPVYPKTALNHNWEGTVKLKVSIAASGKIDKITVHKSSGHSILDQAFIRTVRAHYTFKPKRVAGENQASTKIVLYTFRIDS